MKQIYWFMLLAVQFRVMVHLESLESAQDAKSPGGGDSHMKWTGMLVVSLRGVNFGFWSRLGCLGKMSLFLAVKVLFRVAREEITKKKKI